MSYPLGSMVLAPVWISWDRISSRRSHCTPVLIIAARFCSATCRGSYILDTNRRNTKKVRMSISPFTNNTPPVNATVAIPSFKIIWAPPTKTAVPSSVTSACFSTARILPSKPSMYSAWALLARRSRTVSRHS